MTNLGSKIKTARIRARMSQFQLGRRLGFTSEDSGAPVCRWEKGHVKPTVANLEKIATVLGLNLQALLGIVPSAKELRSLPAGRPFGSTKAKMAARNA